MSTPMIGIKQRERRDLVDAVSAKQFIPGGMGRHEATEGQHRDARPVEEACGDKARGLCRPALLSQLRAITVLGLAKAKLCLQLKQTMASLSLKHLFVMLLAVFVTAGFSLSAAQANVMSAKMTMAPDKGMAMSSSTSMGKMADAAMTGDCKACLKDAAGGSDNPMHCPPNCIAPVLAVLPQDLAVTVIPPVAQPSALPAPFLHGRSSLPDPYPPRSSNLI